MAIINLACVQEAADTAVLAAYIGCDEATLSATLDTASAAAAGTAADQFGRTDLGQGALETPYFVCKTHPARFHTQGGVAIDTDARVVTQRENRFAVSMPTAALQRGSPGRPGPTAMHQGTDWARQLGWATRRDATSVRFRDLLISI